MSVRIRAPSGFPRPMLGYMVKYTEFLSADKLFTFTYRDRAVRELGRR